MYQFGKEVSEKYEQDAEMARQKKGATQGYLHKKAYGWESDENEYEVNNTDGNLDENEAVAEPVETTAMDVASVDPEDLSMTSSASVDRAPLCPLAIALYFGFLYSIASPW